MADIDDELGESFKRNAQPGDPTGVADAIRARLAAGDTGTPATPADFPADARRRWLPWLAAVILLALVGGTIAILAALNLGGPEVAISSSPTPTPTRSASPSPTPTPSDTPTVEPSNPPEQPPPAPAPRDSSAPVITGSGSDVDGGICSTGTGAATVFATVTDNVGVTGVSISWSGGDSGSGAMTQSGSSWTFAYDPPDSSVNTTVTFSIVARDAAGNGSPPATVTIAVVCPQYG
jgi:hypothetical protein